VRFSARRGRACLAACGLSLIFSAPASAQLADLVFNDGFDEPATFRVSDLDLMDPHTYVTVTPLGCVDVTNIAAFGVTGVNPQLQTSIQTDGDGNGLLDLSYVLRLRPLHQGDGALGGFTVATANCTSPLASTSCEADGSNPTVSTYASQADALVFCLQPLPGTTHGYSPAITNSNGPCFASEPATLTLSLAGIPVTLTDASIAARYVGDPASGLGNGLVAGFLSEADANATIIPASIPVVGGLPVSTLLPGGAGNCAGHSDKDVYDGVTGWWLYLNFTATAVDYEG
jgi:hypothetical protein